MHFLIRLVVEAGTEKDANCAAESLMDELVQQGEFDWYNLDPDSTRWPECGKPVQLSTKKGQAWVADALKTEYEEFLQTMNTIRLMCKNYNDDQIFNEEFDQTTEHYYSRYQFSRACGYHANACYLYGEDGASIVNQHELDRYLDAPSKYWVVQVNCHS
jgi:hypothetical protein